MDFMEMYAQKKMTAEQAASLVKSGDWVDYGWCVNTRYPCGRQGRSLRQRHTCTA